MALRFGPPDWPADRLAEARAVIADVVHHSDHLIRLACRVLATHGETASEREDARVLLLMLDARRPVRSAQRAAQGAEGREDCGDHADGSDRNAGRGLSSPRGRITR